MKPLSLLQLSEKFPDEAAAVAWVEETRWPDGRHCPRCGSIDTRETPKRRPMPYRCRGCQTYFSVRTGTPLENSRLPLRKWVFAAYLFAGRPKGISSCQLARDIGVRQATAWHMLHRLREGWGQIGHESDFAGPVEIDETYLGGRRRNMHAHKRRALRGRGAVGKTIALGARDRRTGRVYAQRIEATNRRTLQRFVQAHAARGATVYTDKASAYVGIPFHHEAVNHSRGEYVRGAASTNGIESFWATLKRGYLGTYHSWSPKHVDRYLAEFAGRHNCRESGILDRMAGLVSGLEGRTLPYADLIR